MASDRRDSGLCRRGPADRRPAVGTCESETGGKGLARGSTRVRRLTGRLLLAQETERRRIALELHDDLNQSLALLAVHLDLLGQNPRCPVPCSASGCTTVGSSQATVLRSARALTPVAPLETRATWARGRRPRPVRRIDPCPWPGDRIRRPAGAVADPRRYRPLPLSDCQEALSNVIKHSGAGTPVSS